MCIKKINFIKFNRDDIKNMSYIFHNCASLEQLNFSDLKNVKDEMNENKVTSILNLGIPLYKKWIV